MAVVAGGVDHVVSDGGEVGQEVDGGRVGVCLGAGRAAASPAVVEGDGGRGLRGCFKGGHLGGQGNFVFGEGFEDVV